MPLKRDLNRNRDCFEDDYNAFDHDGSVEAEVKKQRTKRENNKPKAKEAAARNRRCPCPAPHNNLADLDAALPAGL